MGSNGCMLSRRVRRFETLSITRSGRASAPEARRVSCTQYRLTERCVPAHIPTLPAQTPTRRAPTIETASAPPSITGTPLPQAAAAGAAAAGEGAAEGAAEEAAAQARPPNPARTHPPLPRSIRDYSDVVVAGRTLSATLRGVWTGGGAAAGRASRSWRQARLATPPAPRAANVAPPILAIPPHPCAWPRLPWARPARPTHLVQPTFAPTVCTHLWTTFFLIIIDE